jgi:hypothetical protein
MVSNEDFKQEDITPEDLGCMGEQECDPGVKEGSDVVVNNKPQPTTKEEIFRTIPHEMKKKYKKIYDGFTVKDIPFDEFCVEMAMLSNPGVQQSSIMKIIEQKQNGARQKFGIDQAMKRQHMN